MKNEKTKWFAGLPVWRFAMRRWWGKEMHPHKEKDVPGEGAMGYGFSRYFRQKLK